MTNNNHRSLLALLSVGVWLGITQLCCTEQIAGGNGSSSEIGNPAVAGVVIDGTTNTPAPQTIVRLYETHDTLTSACTVHGELVATALSDSRGSYSFDTIDAGRYTLSAEYVRANDTLYACRTIVYRDSSIAITDTLRRPGAIAGRVLLPGSSNANVFCFIPGRSYGAISDSTGSFRIDNLPPGRYSLGFHDGIHNDTTLVNIAVSADSLSWVGELQLRRDPNQYEKHVAGILSGTLQAVAAVRAVVSSTASAHADTFEMAISPTGERYSGFVQTPSATSRWLATIQVLDSVGRIIGMYREHFERTTAIIAIPPFDVHNALPRVNALVDSVVSVNDTIRLRCRAEDPFDGTITAVSWRVGEEQEFVKADADQLIITAPAHATSALRCIVRATDNHGNHGFDTTYITVLQDAPLLQLLSMDSVVDFGAPVRGTLRGVQRFGSLHIELDTLGSGTFAPLQHNQGYCFFSFTTNDSCAWDSIRIRVRDDDGNVVERAIGIDVRPRPIALDTVVATRSAAQLRFHPSIEQDFAAYCISDDKGVVATLTHREDTVFSCDSAYTFNPRTWRVEQIDNEGLVSQAVATDTVATVFCDSSRVVHATFQTDTLSVRMLLDANHLTTLGVERVAQFNAKSEIIALNLMGSPSPIHSLPPVVANLHHLERLAIAHNQVSELPAWIGSLRALEQVVLINTKIQSLPDTLWSLPRLRTLYLADNPLSTLPAKIGRLAALEEFEFVNHTAPASLVLPPALFALRTLNTLHISGALLPHMAPGAVNLPNLRALRLQRCALDSLPPWVSGQSTLQTLIVSQNNLRALPSALGEMGELGYLEASDNQLSTIAQNLSRLWKLRTLLLAGNNLQELPQDIALLENVKVVDVFGNKLCSLSDEQKKWLTTRQRQWQVSQRCQ